jgi:hypothetical protein
VVSDTVQLLIHALGLEAASGLVLALIAAEVIL